MTGLRDSQGFIDPVAEMHIPLTLSCHIFATYDVQHAVDYVNVRLNGRVYSFLGAVGKLMKALPASSHQLAEQTLLSKLPVDDGFSSSVAASS